MLVPLVVLALGAVLAGVRVPEVLHRLGDYDGVLGQGALRGPGQPHPARHARGPGLGRLGAVHAPWPRASRWPTLYYIAAPWLPAATARAFRPLYLFLLNKWYFDELYDLLFVRPAFWIGRAAVEGRRRRDHRRHRIDGTRRRVQDATNGRRQAADRLRLPLRLRHADRRRRPHHLVHVRRRSRADDRQRPICLSARHLPAAGRRADPFATRQRRRRSPATPAGSRCGRR